MLIQTLLDGVSKIVHDGVEYAVEKGYALVSVEAGQHLTQFPEWSVVTEEVDKKIMSILEKTKPKQQEEVKPVADPANDGSDKRAE